MSQTTPERVLAMLCAAGQAGGRLPRAEAAALLGVEDGALEAVAERLSGFGVPPLGPGDYLDVEVTRREVVVHQDLGLSTPLRLSAVDGALLLACLDAVAGSLPGDLEALRGSARARLLGALRPDDDAPERAAAVGWASEGTFDPAVLAALHAAVVGREELQLRYFNHSRDRVEQRRVRPCRVVQHQGRWYLVAWCLWRDGYRQFRLDRIFRVDGTGERFGELPDAPALRRAMMFDAPESMVEVAVRFDADRRDAALRWFADAALGDDAALVVLRGPTLPVVLRRLFGVGGGWAVVGPDDARAMVRAWCGAGDA